MLSRPVRSAIAAVVAAVAVVAILSAYVQSVTIFEDEWSRDEVARVSPPSGQLDAVLFELNGGATTSFAYEIAVVTAGRKPRKDVVAAFLYGAARSPSAYGVNMRWDADRILVVEYFEARMAELRAAAVGPDGTPVTVELRSGVSDPTAPTGGMRRN